MVDVMDAIRFDRVTKRYGSEEILTNLSLTVPAGKFFALLGPSGCGKTTILRLIGGFEHADSGKIFLDNIDVTDVPINQRRVNTVFQYYALFPHLNVFDNVAYGLRIKGVALPEIKHKVMHVLTKVHLEKHANKSIEQLSGGQQQRVALARAIVNEPKVLLLDEPLGALDLKLRQEMQYELKEMQVKLGITFVYVTHDQEEALTMSDTIVIMNEGKILQIGTPEDIYNEPKSRFVANFIGDSNIFKGIMREDYLVEFFEREFKCIDKGFETNEPVDVVIRPEDFDFIPPSKAKIVGIVDSLIFKGVHYEINVIVAGHEYTIHTTKYRDIGSKVGLMVEPQNIHIMHKERP